MLAAGVLERGEIEVGVSMRLMGATLIVVSTR